MVTSRASSHPLTGGLVTKMSRAALLCCTALALFSVGAAHAQQGNLPTPVQKLPAYPPVVCVTPNWMPEPCESRQVSDEGGRWEWQCGNVNVKVTQKVTLLEKPFNLPTSTEYVVTGIEKSNNRFQYVWGKDDLYLNGRLCVLKAKPLPKKDETKPEPPTAEPVKCLKPDGTEEPCESRDTAQPLTPEERYRAWRGEELRQDRPPTNPLSQPVVISFGRGGNINEHVALFTKYRTVGTKVELRGPCYSACTIITAYVAKENLCIAEGAFMAFHAARVSMGSPTIAGGATIRMVDAYPIEIRQWIDRNGGVGNLPHDGFWTMYDRDLWQMGYPRCAP